LDRLRRRRGVEPGQGQGVDRGGRPDVAGQRLLVGPRLRQLVLRRPRQHHLRSVPGKPGLHEQLDVPVSVRAGHVEADRAAPCAVAQQVLNEAEANVAGLGLADGIELDDRPVIAVALALDPQQTGEPAVVLEHVQQVVGAEGAERKPEEAEHADRRAAYRQAQRSRRLAVVLA
jgi:hypothetical protein